MLVSVISDKHGRYVYFKAFALANDNFEEQVLNGKLIEKNAGLLLNEVELRTSRLSKLRRGVSNSKYTITNVTHMYTILLLFLRVNIHFTILNTCS